MLSFRRVPFPSSISVLSLPANILGTLDCVFSLPIIVIVAEKKSKIYSYLSLVAKMSTAVPGQIEISSLVAQLQAANDISNLDHAGRTRLLSAARSMVIALEKPADRLLIIAKGVRLRDPTTTATHSTNKLIEAVSSL